MQKLLKRILVVTLVLSLCTSVALAAVVAPYFSEEVEAVVKASDHGGFWRTEAFNVQELPRNFRTVRSAMKEQKNNKKLPNLLGLRELRLSGSAQPSVLQLGYVLEAIKQEGSPASTVYIVDLRQEYHGYFNGLAAGWYTTNAWGNIYKPQAEILSREKELLRGELGKQVRLYKLQEGKPVYSSSESVLCASTEEEVVKQHGAHYLRYTNTDHVWPLPEQIDNFLKFYKQLPPNAWLHFHCHAGKGRTTSYMAMVDIINNASKVRLEDIVLRQRLLGGANLFSVKGKKGEPWRKIVNADKVDKLRLFYRYVQEQPQLNMPWSTWLESRLAKRTA